MLLVDVTMFWLGEFTNLAAHYLAVEQVAFCFYSYHCYFYSDYWYFKWYLYSITSITILEVCIILIVEEANLCRNLAAKFSNSENAGFHVFGGFRV